MKTKCAKTLAVLTASLLSLSVAGQAAAKDRESKPKHVHSGDGVKLMAEARNNKIVGWSATDDKGNKLPTTVKRDSTGKVKGIIVHSRPQRVSFRPERVYIY